jgi:hypothetical protein
MRLAPEPAWTKEIGGVAYTVKHVGAGIFSIWRGPEKLGFFELSANTNFCPVASTNLGSEARHVASVFAEMFDADQAAER